jgi:vitamin B12 transporter
VNKQWRRAFNFTDSDPFNGGISERSSYNSSLIKIDVQNNYQLNKMNKLMGGVEITNERGDLANRFQSPFGPFVSELGNHTATNVGLYFQDYIKLTDRWFTTAGARWDRYNRFGHATTYRVATSYVIPETGTTFKASYGTGFKAPTLYQLYSSFGNTNLNAEKSRGWDMGVEQKLFKNSLLLGATYYHNYVNNLINTVDIAPFVSQYSNVGNARMVGSEVYSTWTPRRWLTARGSYTATYARDLDTHEQLLRRPRHKMSFNVNIQPTQKFNINLDITHFGSRRDNDFFTFPATRVTLNPYTLINLALSYKLSGNCTIFGRLVNLLDTPYENVKGYGSPRLSAYGGLQIGI